MFRDGFGTGQEGCRQNVPKVCFGDEQVAPAGVAGKVEEALPLLVVRAFAFPSAIGVVSRSRSVASAGGQAIPVEAFRVSGGPGNRAPARVLHHS